MFDTKSQQKLGNGEFYWFIGVVEDINDPLQLGRIRVRILGDHTQSTKHIPTTSLPWAYIINDIHSASMQGIGTSPTGLYTKGSWVFGFYWDGMDKQQPVILGSIGGIPESIPWNPKKVNEEDPDKEESHIICGFQDPDLKFPLGNAIFEQDTNRLARNVLSDHAIEVPEYLVPPQEKMIRSGRVIDKPEFAKEYYDTFDENYVRKFAQGEHSKNSKNDVVASPDSPGNKTIQVESKSDEVGQYYLKNNHPFTVYKFINRERFIPKAKPFTDPFHWEYWHEPDNPWDAQYPYNVVWEGYHEEGSTQINNPNNFVSESYAYDISIEGYDGSPKEKIHRKQKCGIGSWGLGEERDSTPGKERYHRFHPSGNYFEIDKDGNEVRKIYGDSFEIDVKNKNIYIKGDWNITVEGNKNELVMGDYNLQIMGNKNEDIRGSKKVHIEQDYNRHVKEKASFNIDNDYQQRIKGNRSSTILKNDYVESLSSETVADTIKRRGISSIIDEGTLEYELKAKVLKIEACEFSIDATTSSTSIQQQINNIKELTENITTYLQSIGLYSKNTGLSTEKHGFLSIDSNEFNGTIATYNLNTDAYSLKFGSSFSESQAGFAGNIPPMITDPDNPVFNSDVSYPETSAIIDCIKKYEEAIQKAKESCITKLIDPRTLKEYERFDWDKYHASLKTCYESYLKCIEKNKDEKCNVCSPKELEGEWDCKECYDPDCSNGDKEWTFYSIEDKYRGTKEQEEKKNDPWEECEKDNC